MYISVILPDLVSDAPSVFPIKEAGLYKQLSDMEYWDQIKLHAQIYFRESICLCASVMRVSCLCRGVD